MKLLIGTVSLNTRPLTEIWIETLERSLRKAGIVELNPTNRSLVNGDLTNEVKTVIVDNGSTDGVMELAEKYPWITFIRNETNLGVSPAWNQIIKTGYDDSANPLYDYYAPANNDIFFTDDWAANFIKCLNQDTKKEFGWISSMMNDYKEPHLTGISDTVALENRYWAGIRPDASEVETKEQMINVIRATYAPLGGIEQFSKMLVNKYGVKLMKMHPRAPFFVLSKECIAIVGLFDEYNCPTGLHEDLDYCIRIANYSKLKIGAAFGAYLHHYSMMTRTKDEFKNDWVPMREAAFKRKWGAGSDGIHLIPKDFGMKLEVDCESISMDGANWYHMGTNREVKGLEFIGSPSIGLSIEDSSLDEVFYEHKDEDVRLDHMYTTMLNIYGKLKVGKYLRIKTIHKTTGIFIEIAKRIGFKKVTVDTNIVSMEK